MGENEVHVWRLREIIDDHRCQNSHCCSTRLNCIKWRCSWKIVWCHEYFAFKVNSRSPLNQKKLSERASQLEQQICKIGLVLGTRWVARPDRTVSAMWQYYEALCFHFEKKWKMKQDLWVFEKPMEVWKKIASEQFLFDLALIYGTFVYFICVGGQTNPTEHKVLAWTRKETWH